MIVNIVISSRRNEEWIPQYALYYFCRQEILSESSFGRFNYAVTKKVFVTR